MVRIRRAVERCAVRIHRPSGSPQATILDDVLAYTNAVAAEIEPDEVTMSTSTRILIEGRAEAPR